jgi:metal-responsive CopG/Arc/MetJ family transcriptional regulator
MKSMKIAISVPDQVFEAGEHLAQQMGLSRSQLYSDALAAYLSVRGAQAVTARLNAVYETVSSKLDPALESYQLKHLADEAW